jgi:branched-chain amino acid transport system substrate-binding protein
MGSKITLMTMAFLVVTLLVAGCTTGQAIEQKDTITIGSIQALTGETSWYGQNQKNAITLAIDDINRVGGINGKKIEVIFEDSACDENRAISAIKKLTQQQGLKVILGPTCSGEAMAIAPIAESANVIMMASVPSILELKHQGEYIFRNRVPGGPYSKKIAEFSIQRLGAKTAAVLYINLHNGVGYKDEFVGRFQELGGKILVSESYEKGDIDFRTQLTKIKSQNPDVIFIGGQAYERSVKQARELGINTQIIGPITIEGPQLIEIAGTAAEGIYYSYSKFDPENLDPISAGYQRRYEAYYGEKSEAYAANGYDATILVAQALRKCGEKTDCIRDYLYSVQNFAGVGGLTSFDSYGEVSKPLIIKTVKNGEFVKVE